MKKVREFFRYDNIGLLFALPAFVYMVVFVGYPIISNLILSFQNVTVRNLVRGPKGFVGFGHYIKLFHDEVFIRSLVNSLVFTIGCLIVQFMIGFGLALFFNKNFAFSRPVRGLLMIPWMIPMTVTALIFKFMFATDVGIINYLLRSMGIIKNNIEWLTTPGTAMFAVIVANIWIGIPFNTILLSTGLTTVPLELYESASIDGANAVQKFFRVTLPLLRPTIESMLVLGFIYTFKVYDLVYVMTGGGPVNSTHLLSTYSYKLSFEMFQYSNGAAVANVLLVILLMVGMVYLRITMKGEED
ncbi:MAG: carbohydrate ABC transporter permease [Lachnospiraceae bacterium]